MTDNATERIGDYELLALIGDGAQGRVYKAIYRGEDTSKVAKDEIVAMKVIRITGDDEKLRHKFQDQAEILRRLSHTNIVRYRDSFSWHAAEWDEAQCLVMEFLEGETLTERLKKANAGLPWSQVETVFEQCLAGLIHARERGITHRDLKPSNIFITQDGSAKLIDFDIARRDDSGQMSTAGWKGTFDYMAPDFITINGFRGDETSDVFSLGVCFYQALTGALPYDPLGDTAHIGYLNRWRDGGAPSPSFRPGIFRVLSNAKPFAAKCLSAKREQRYPTFAAMLEDFRKIRTRRVRHKNKDEYELLAVLGRGGFGEVFKARRLSDGLLVAVKHLFAEKQSDRFIKEAKILQQYPHPNLCKYVDFIVADGTAGEKQYFLILEFLEGMPGWTLRTRLKNEGPMEASEAIPLYIGYLSALQFLHENSRPIIHRDIKPGNLYAPAGQPTKGKIFDLGVARDVSGTVTVGGVPGTLDYMPPEFAEAGGDRGSPQSDIYALGLCLYESLTARPVYDRLPTDLNSAWLAFQQRLRKPLEVSFEAGAFRQYPRLKGVILKALAPRSAERYRSAAEMRKELENILAGTGVTDAHEDESLGEMTVATLHSFSNDDDAHLPEPGATLGTRPLEVAGATQQAPVDLIAAGKAEADRRRARKRLVWGGGIAAGVLLAIGLTSWIVSALAGRHATATQEQIDQALQAVEQAAGDTAVPAPTAAFARLLGQAYLKAVKTGEKFPELSDRIDEQRRRMRKTGAALPAEFQRGFDAALAAGKADKAAALLKEWQEAEPFIDIMDVTKDRFAERTGDMQSALKRAEIEGELTALRQDIPDVMQTDDALDKGEVIAAKLKALRGRPWPGFDEAEKQKRLAAMTVTVSERAFPQIVRLKDAAVGKYRAGQDGDPERDALLRFAGQRPALTEILQAAYTDAKGGVEAARQGRLATTGLAKVMDRAANAKDDEAVRAAAQELATLEATPNAGLTAGQVRSAEEAITTKYAFFAQGVAQQARTAFDTDKMDDGVKAQKALADLVSSVPVRFGKGALGVVERDVEARRGALVARQAQLAATRAKEVGNAGTTLTDLRDRVRKGDLTACVDGVRILSEFSATALADPAFRAQRDAVSDDFVKLVEQAVSVKDPLAQRAVRLKAADEVVTASAADKVFGSRIRALREGLGKQKVIFVLRLVNKAGQSVRVSGKDLRDTLTLAPGAVQDVDLAVQSANTLASLLIEGGADSKPRIETVTLVAAGGQELMLTPLEKVTVAGPVSGSAGVTPAVVVSAKPVSAGKGLLDITIIPRTAALAVDGMTVKAGGVEVTPEETHKVSVEAPGYKPCLQYYRVKPGEVRKIEIFLEKAARRGLW